ncbi:Response regulator MprA [compost metagenome]
MLTALDKPSDRVEGLNSGASDYLPKPFDLDELIARVNVQLRARNGRPRTCHALGDLTLDESTREVFRAEQRINLTAKEFDLLTLFLRHPRQLLTRQQLLDGVWGADFYGDDNVLEVYVHYLRTKIERKGWSKMIHTVRGVGYLIKPGEAT